MKNNEIGQNIVPKRKLMKFECIKCGRFSVINAVRINPFLGKIIKLNCGNPICNITLKIQVPEK